MCNHDFKYSHTEYESEYCPVDTFITRVRVYICTKCGKKITEK